MSLLPAVGTFSYGGYTFNGSTKSVVSSRMVYDQAGRTVSYVVYLLKANTIVQSASGTDSAMLDLRNRLSKSGQALVYTGHGFGDFSINTTEGAGNQKDVVYGPKPIRCDMENMGIPNCYVIHWECEVAIPQCTNAKYRFAPLAFNYEIDYRIEQHGLTTRVYSGYLEIPATRWTGGSRRIYDTVDKYREHIVPPLIPGFKRAAQEFKVSKDKRVLQFSITDEQIQGDGIPEFCTAATGKHSMQSTGGSTYQFEGVIQATYHVAYGYEKTRGWEVFAELIRDRLGHAKRATPTNSDGTDAVWVHSAKMEEGLYENGRWMSFEIGYWISSTIEAVMMQSGQWRKIPRTQWGRWADAIGPAHMPRGVANLFHSSADDAIIDLCGSTPIDVPIDYQTLLTPNQKTELRELRVNPGLTWVKYESRLTTIGSPGTSVMKTLPEKPLPTSMSTGGPLAQPRSLSTVPPLSGTQPPKPPPTVKGDDDPSSALLDSLTDADTDATWEDMQGTIKRLMLKAKLMYPKSAGDSTGNGPLPPKPKPKIIPLWLYVLNKRFRIQQSLAAALTKAPDILQQRTTPAYRVLLNGYGVRVGYKVPYPTLYSVGGVGAVPDGEGKFEQWVAGNWGGFPVYCARWSLPFRLLEAPKTAIPVPQNPALLVGG